MSQSVQILPRYTPGVLPETVVEAGEETVLTPVRQTTNTLMRVDVLKDFAAVKRCEKAWRALEDTAARSFHLFQSYDWCVNWIENYTLDNDCYGIHIVTVWKGDEIVCLWPMMTTCVGPLCVLRWLTDPYAQYGDALVHPDADKTTVLDLAWRELTSHDGVDGIRLRHVRQDANVFRFLKQRTEKGGPNDTAPFLNLKDFPDEGAYEARYSKQQRRRRKRIHKRLSEMGRIEFAGACEPAAIEKAVNNAIAEKRRWLKDRGRISKPLMSDGINDFLKVLFAKSKSLTPVVSVLKSGDREISWEVGLRYKGRHCGFITAHDNSLTDASPARLHMHLSQRMALSDGCDTFDLLVPGDTHKKSWSNGAISTSEFYRPLGLRGRVFAMVYLHMVRPVARALYHGTSATTKRTLMRLIGR